MSEWNSLTVGEISKIKNGFAFKGTDFISEGVPVIKIKNIKPLKFETSEFSYVSQETAKGKGNYLVKKGDILISMSGNRADGSPDSWVGKVCQFKLDGEYLLNQRVSIIEPNRLFVVPEFLTYLLASWDYQTLLISLANSSGGQANISPDTVKSLEILLPPLHDQEAIAEVLSSLDDEIDLLHRQNKTLEQMAETLFRQWFIVEVDTSWPTIAVGEAFETRGGGTPSTTNPQYWDGNIYWTSPRDLSGSSKLFMSNTEKKITEAGLAKISSGLLPVGTVLLSSRAPIGYLAITSVPVAINQGYIACLPTTKISSCYLHNWLKTNMEVIQSVANGSTFMEISKSTFRQLDFVLPPEDRLSRFDVIAGDLYMKIKANEKQVMNLKSIRDTLLPKAMSGQVRVVNKILYY